MDPAAIAKTLTSTQVRAINLWDGHGRSTAYGLGVRQLTVDKLTKSGLIKSAGYMNLWGIVMELTDLGRAVLAALTPSKGI